MDPFAIATSGIGLLSSLFGRKRKYSESDFDADPNNLSLEAYNEARDPNSATNRRSLDNFRTLATDAAPGLDSLLGLTASQGLLGGGAAYQQSKGQTVRAREAGLRMFENHLINQQANSAKFLEMYMNKEYQKKIAAYGDASGREETSLSFGENILKTGMGLLSYSQGRKSNPTEEWQDADGTWHYGKRG